MVRVIRANNKSIRAERIVDPMRQISRYRSGLLGGRLGTRPTYAGFYHAWFMTRWWMALAMALSVTACLPDADQSSNTSSATLVVSARYVDQPSTPAAARAVNTPPAPVTSLVIRVFSSTAELVTEGAITFGEVLHLPVPPGIKLTIIGSAYAGDELRFRGEASIPALLPGLGTTVALTLTPAAEPSFVTPVQVDITSSGERGTGVSTGAIFADGNRKILFWSTADKLVPGDTNQTRDLFMRDLVTGLVVNVNSSTTGEPANAPVGAADINSAGTLVVFSTAASNLVSTTVDANGDSDVFLRDIAQGQTQLLSLNKAGTSVLAPSLQPSLTDDAQWVFFQSDGELTGTGERGIFSIDRNNNNALRFIGPGSLPRVSANGDAVVYWDAQAKALKIRDFRAGVGEEEGIIVQPYSVPIATDPTVPELFTPYAVNFTGKFVVYALASTSSGVVSGVYLHDHFAVGTRTRLISVGADGTPLVIPAGTELLPSLSADGRFVAFAVGTTLYIKDTVTSELASLSIAGTKATISDDGRLIAYSDSESQNLFVVRNPIADAAPTPGNTSNVSFGLTVGEGGLVTTLDGALSCPGAACTLSVPRGTLLTLNAKPATGFEFQGWSGGCTGNQTPFVLTLQDNVSCTASFAQVRRSLVLTITGGPNAGSVASDVNPTPNFPCVSGNSAQTVCSTTFPTGTNVTLTPKLAGNNNVVVWQGCDSDRGLQGCTVKVDRDRPITAAFGTQSFTVALGRTGTGTGTITSSDGKLNCGAICESSYIGGTTVTLTAQAASSSAFSGWSGDCAVAGTDPTVPTVTVTVTKATSCSAAFTVVRRTLTVTKSGTGTGEVNSLPAGIACGPTCRADFTSGTLVRLLTVPAANSVFNGWSGASCTVASSGDVLMDRNRTCVATFDLQTFTLTVNKTGSGGGTVTSQPAGINCGATCNANFTVGQAVTLTASVSAGSVFSGWTGACTGTNGSTATVTMDAAKSCTAAFTRRFELAVEFSGSGAGTIDVAPSGTSCTTNCNPEFDSGSVVTLTARPSANTQFGGWSGDCATNATNPTVATVTMDAAKRCVAQFLATFSLSVEKTGNGQGVVVSDDGRLDCGANCAADYVEGSNVTLTARPISPAVFAGWSEGCTVGTNPTVQVSVTAATKCIATFNENTVTFVQTLPASPGVLTFNELVAVDFTFKTAVSNGVVITVHPLTLGSPSPGENPGNSPTLNGGTGSGSASFTVIVGDGTPVIVDQVLIEMRSTPNGPVIAETIVDVAFTFQQLL